MSLLTRYLLRQNIFLNLTILFAGTCLYLLTDLFERLEDFIDAGISVGLIATFFAMKIPMIISQILPAVFLLAFVIQLNILERTKELMALQAGGVSPFVLLRFIILYGVLWAVGQFFFAQVLGVTGDRVAGNIWQSDVRGNDTETITLRNRWLTDYRGDKARVIHIGRAVPNQGHGSGLLVYLLDPSGVKIEEIIRAESFTIDEKYWLLKGVIKQSPASFSTVELDEFVLPIRQNLKGFQIFEKTGSKPSQLPLWELGRTIRQLEKAGSNVEALRTAWHVKLSYAASLVVMGLLALVVSRLTPNIYKAVGGALLLVFVFYSINTFCVTLGEKGLVSPVIAGWFADILLSALSLLWLSIPWLRQKLTPSSAPLQVAADGSP